MKINFLPLSVKKYLRISPYFLCVLFLFGSSACSYEDTHAIAGKVGFFKHANTAFDSYTTKPDAKQQQWMQSHYQGILTYTPYFDARLSWYPNAWFYIDSYAIYVNSDIAQKHPEWIMQDAQKNRLYIPWECHGKCEQFVGDFSNPDFKKYKIEEIRTALAKGYQGVWIDDVNLTWRVSDNNEIHRIPMDRLTNKPMTLTDWQRYFTEFMEEIRRAFPSAKIAHNAIWYADTMTTENPFINRQIKAANYINIERAGNDSGLTAGNDRWGYETFLHYLDYVHQQGAGSILMDFGTTATEREYGLATALLISNGNDFISSNHPDWTTPDHWWPGYALNLGKALKPHYSWQGLLRRDFECGQVLLNQPQLPEKTITLEGDLHTIDGTAVKQLKLQGKTAAVLLKSCTRK